MICEFFYLNPHWYLICFCKHRGNLKQIIELNSYLVLLIWFINLCYIASKFSFYSIFKYFFPFFQPHFANHLESLHVLYFIKILEKSLFFFSFDFMVWSLCMRFIQSCRYHLCLSFLKNFGIQIVYFNFFFFFRIFVVILFQFLFFFFGYLQIH